MKTILNVSNKNYHAQPLFLGEDLALQRYDNPKHKVFLDLFKKQLSLYWRPEEISLIKDRNDFKVLTENERFIFTKNLQFQTLMDSVIARGVPTVTQYVSNPELEVCLSTWQFFENIHSYAYTYIIQNVYADPSSILDECLLDTEILARCESVAGEYNKLMHAKDDIKTQIYLTLISINILEAIRFYVSFVCAFNFGENKKMIGNADIVKLIKRDEAVHLSITQNIINILRNSPDEGFQDAIHNSSDRAIEMFHHAANEEKAWASYLFKDGGLLGLNSEIMSQYIEWLTDSRMEMIGLPKQFNIKRSPIRGWIEPWMNSEVVQVAPQESEITSYKIGASLNDLDEMNLDMEL